MLVCILVLEEKLPTNTSFLTQNDSKDLPSIDKASNKHPLTIKAIPQMLKIGGLDKIKNRAT